MSQNEPKRYLFPTSDKPKNYDMSTGQGFLPKDDSSVVYQYRDSSGTAHLVEVPRSGWTDEDDDDLIHLYNKGRSQKHIAAVLGRTYKAVNSRIYRLRKEGRIT